jgi:hypothetical protein
VQISCLVEADNKRPTTPDEIQEENASDINEDNFRPGFNFSQPLYWQQTILQAWAGV